MNLDPAALRTRLQAALGSTFTLEHELGGGSTARVFVARDARLGRRVAVKVLAPDLAADLSAERFEREMRLDARLQHPHILPLLSAGDVDGLPYFTMPFIEGESLRSRFEREGALPVADAVRLVREVADALAHAHAEGIVHRDLKPENVLLSHGHAVIADFGVAKALAASAHVPGDDVLAFVVTGATRVGLAVGTPAYMAPEQALADPATDHRADLYSLGVIAYEALAGAHPFANRGPHAMITAHLTEAPPPLAARRPDVPPTLAGLVAWMLEKCPEQRPSSALTVVRALDAATLPREAGAEVRTPDPAPHRMPPPAALGAALALAGLGALLWPRSTTAPTPDAPPPPATLVDRRVAVVPFDNQTGDSALGPLGSLASEWIVQGLAGAAIGEVVDPYVARATWQEAPNPRAVGAATGARLVVGGAYYLEGDTLRLLARISDAADGRLLRALDPVSAPAATPRLAVAALRERVLGAVGGMLDVHVVAGAPATDLPPTLAAYRRWSAGLDHLHRNAHREAIGEFLAAARMDSTFVSPVFWAGVAYGALGEPAKADSLLRLAARSRDRLSPADRAWLALELAENRGEWAAALRAAREGVRTAPRGSAAEMNVAWNAVRTNRPREAVAALATLDPERPPTRTYVPYWKVLTQAHHQLGDYEGELRAAAHGLRLHPDNVPVLFAEARALAALGRPDEAVRLLDALLELPPDPMYTHGEIVTLLGRELRAHGHEAAARETFARALRWYDERPAAERATPALRGRRAEVLYALARWDEARAAFEALLAERVGEPNPIGDKGMLGLARLGEVDYRGYLGALAARRGDRAAALAADRALAARRQPYLLGRHVYWRARIAALSGGGEDAVTLLHEALRQGRTHLVLHAEADLAPLRRLRSFRELVRPRG